MSWRLSFSGAKRPATPTYLVNFSVLVLALSLGQPAVSTAQEAAATQAEEVTQAEVATEATPTETAETSEENAPAAEAAEAAPAESNAAKPAAKAFDAVFSEWKSLLKGLRDLRVEAQIADDKKVAELQKDYDAKIAVGKELEPKLKEAALNAYGESPNVDRELVRFLITIAADQIREDDYVAAKKLTSLLSENNCEEKELNDLAGIVAFGTNDFEAAETYLKKADEEGTISSQGAKFLPAVTGCKERWVKELEVQKAEAEADDLPRIKLQTDAGDIVIELFENEAPETVGNIVSLVEKGFYDGLGFHRVLNAFMAQGGCPEGTGGGGPGYNIYCECVNENHRKHFAGSLSMAKQSARNTGGSQFFITYVPTSFLDGQHTVFGRVIEGWDVLPKIVKRDPDGAPPFPDMTKIVKATVVRKRDHDYRPNKVK